MSKILISVVFILSSVVLAAEKYGVYDLQGNRISAFDAELYELPQKTLLAKEKEPNKNLYVSSLSKGKSSKPTSRYRYKAETGAYIEAARKETISICPDKEIQGTWISEHSVSLNAENCLIVQAQELAGTFKILFIEDNSKTDTIQVLVDQSYIQMGDYSHKIWVADTPPESCHPYRSNIVCSSEFYGHYENTTYEQPLIVDKTEFTMGDAWQYSEFGIKLNQWLVGPSPVPTNFTYRSNSGPIEFKPLAAKIYPPEENLKTSMRPYIDNGSNALWQLANMRSKLEGLDTVYRYVKNEKGNFVFTLDTNATGYRMLYKDEWGMLMRAGASTRYYWGDEEDSLTVSRYSWVHPFGDIQHKAAQKIPNNFGLYDMINPNNVSVNFGAICRTGSREQMHECSFLERKVARLIESNVFQLCEIGATCKKILTTYFEDNSTRFLRKTPKLHKLEKF